MLDSRTRCKAQRARVWGTTTLKFGTRACQCLARQPLFFAACKCKLGWAWVHTNLGVPGSCEKVVLYPFLVVPCPMFSFYRICKCFYNLSWKTVFNIEQNAVSYDSSIVVNVINNQTRWWRHLWSYTKGPASEHRIKWISCVVWENPTSRYHLERKKQQHSKNEVKTGKESNHWQWRHQFVHTFVERRI